MNKFKLRLSKEYTIDELFELIKFADFEAGKPELVSYGPKRWIVFPLIDRKNQIVVGGSMGEFYVQRSTCPIVSDNESPFNNVSTLKKYFGGIASVLSNHKQLCQNLVESVGEQINSMRL